MKRLVTYLTAVVMLAMTGCKGGLMREELRRVDSLNQNEIPLDTVTTMQDVVDYFDTWGSAWEKMLAHYLLGCVFRDQNNVPMALRCYRDAVGYADTTAADCDFRRLSRIYGQMAELFNRQRAPRLELEAERKAVDYAWRAKDTLSALIFYGYLEGPYHMLNKMDSALHYNQEAIRLLKRHGYPNYAAGFQPTNIDNLLRQNNYQKAKEAMDEYERCSGFLIKKETLSKARKVIMHGKVCIMKELISRIPQSITTAIHLAIVLVLMGKKWPTKASSHSIAD